MTSVGLSRRLMTAAVSLGLLACSAEEPVVDQAPPFKLRPIEGFTSPRWTGRQAPEDPVVASVGETNITVSMLKAQLERSGEGADPKLVLQRMIEFELLAREALAAGHYTDEVVGVSMRKALTRAWIEDHFENNLKPQDMDPAFKKRVYERMQGLFDHYERFYIADAQILCCELGNPEACYSNLFDEVEDRVRHFEACFDYHKEDADKLRAALAPARTLEEFEERFQVASMDYPQPALRTQFGTRSLLGKYDFQYDVDRTYDEQFGEGVTITYKVFAQPVMDGAKEAWFAAGRTTPALSQVLRTEFGYHILFIHKVDPERHSPLSDPDVQREIEDNAWEPWRKIHFGDQMEKLCQRAGCEVHHQRLVPLQEAEAGK